MTENQYKMMVSYLALILDHLTYGNQLKDATGAAYGIRGILDDIKSHIWESSGKVW